MELLGPQVTCLGLELDCQGLSATVQQEQLTDANGSHQLSLRLKMVFGREDNKRKESSLMLTYGLDEPHLLTSCLEASVSVVTLR